MVGQVMKAEQEQHVIGDIKHYALNDQESGRNAVNVNIDKRAARETDLLAFEIGIHDSGAQAVMCSYNRLWGDFACENQYLLNDLLKKEWNFKGFVVSDWGATHSTGKASKTGLDHEEPGEYYYGDALKKAVDSGNVPLLEIDDHVHRILRAMFASGLVDDPAERSVVDVVAGFETSQKIAESSMVLLKNNGNVLPLDENKIHSIVLIGGHADVGMLSGGGSAQVDPPGGNAIMPPGKGQTYWQAHIWFPTSPLRAMRAHSPKLTVTFDAGSDPNSAAATAKAADVAIVFAHQWQSEDMDLDTLGLLDRQDDLIAAVAKANPRTVVVVESGTAVLMPWADRVSGIVEVWYPGSRGAEALARVLFGDVNPSAKLPMTFPKSDADLPHPQIIKPPKESVPDWSNPPKAWESMLRGLQPFPVKYDEGLKVGYKWYDAEKKEVLFPFGYGLSYTSYAYSNLKVTPGEKVTVTFTVANTGKRDGEEVAQVYASLPASAGEPPKRLVGWNKVSLKAGESKQVSVEVESRMLSIFDTGKNGWTRLPGDYGIMVGASSLDLPLKTSLNLN
jgi:beta-glucosidase